MDSTINGTDFSESFTNSLRGAIANDIGALAANEIGDISSSYGFKNGGFTKTTLHAISQGAVAELAGGDFEAGAAAGAAVELTGELIGKIEDQNTQVDVAGLVGATAGVIATGDAEGAYTGQNAGGVVHRFNHLNHQEKTELEFAKKECNRGDQGACNRRDELNQLDYERNASMQTACSVGSTEECQAQIDFAQANYDSYEGQIDPFDDVNVGIARNDILVYLNDPDGSKRAADQAFLDNAPSNVITGVAGVFTVMTYGACANAFSLAEIALEMTSLDYDKLLDGKLLDDYNSSKPLVGGLGLGLSETINDLPGMGQKGKTVFNTLNFLYGYGYDQFVDSIDDDGGKHEQ